MKILIVGGGGREHAIGWKIKQSQKAKQIFFAPGNGGTAELGTNIAIQADETEKLADYAAENHIDFTIVGPEAPLQLGIADIFRERGLRILAPDKNGARLETSKAFAKSFMNKYGIPTARYETYTDARSASRALENWEYPLVIKADGLAAGKGVMICETKEAALEAVSEIMEKKIFGGAGDKIVIEEFLKGKEVSLLCFTDGVTIVPMESAADYKRALDNDEGLNTGGMGSVSPAPHYKNEMDAGAKIAQKTLKGIQAEGFDYRGVIYIGLMMTDAGPKVLEYNARFGDPETEALMLRLNSDLLDILRAVESKTLKNIKIDWKPDPAICVVIASGGYPGSYKTGCRIELPPIKNDAVVFHGGTALENGVLKTTGGRVLMVCAAGETIEQARESAYNHVEKIYFENLAYRKDIGILVTEGTMKKHYEGKTKIVYDLGNGLFKLFFKDDVTGADGKFDPGANTVGLTIDGTGMAGLKMSIYLLKLLTEKGVKNHFVSADEPARTMTVKPITNFGNGLEVVCRFKALGGFIRRYGGYVKEGESLDALVEMTLKDDDRGDPLITQDALEQLGILKKGEYDTLRTLAREISTIIKEELAIKGLDLCDIKLEFGRDKDGEILLVDELSGGNMRVLENGKFLMPIELAERVLGE